MKPLTLLLASTLLTTVATAQGLDVAIVAAATTSSADCRFTDPEMMLMGTGQFNSVSIINAATSTPTLADLTPFDAVITWSNSAYQDPVGMGNVFADYVDQGGGVVVATFALGAGGAPLFLQGRWTSGYEVVIAQVGQTSGQASLGMVYLPGHPVMAGVTTFNGGTSSYRPTTTTLVPGATAIADWDDGRVLAAAGPLPGRVDLTFYPPSSLCRADFWDSSTDGAQLMANALSFVAGNVTLGTPYCTPGVVNSSGSASAMSATGSAQVTLNDLTLVASNLPQASFGFFITSQTQGMVGQPNGSQGVLCLGGAIGRYVGAGQIQNSGGAGEISLQVNLSQHPTPTGLVQVMPGETWNFQLWHRDVVGGMTTSNFSDGLELLFL